MKQAFIILTGLFIAVAIALAADQDQRDWDAYKVSDQSMSFCN